MGLIVIAAGDRDIGPSRAWVNIVRGLAKAKDSPEVLGAYSGAFEADSAELARTEAGRVGQRVQRNDHARRQPRKGSIDGIERSRLAAPPQSERLIARGSLPES